MFCSAATTSAMMKNSEDQRTASLQQREAGREPDRREERVLQRHLQRRVELERLRAVEKYRIARMPATGRPPHTGAGMLTRARAGIRRRSP